MNFDSFSVERRSDGSVVVRIPSQDRGCNTLPSAAFAFRSGDPQYQRWEQIWLERQSSPGAMLSAG